MRIHARQETYRVNVVDMHGNGILLFFFDQLTLAVQRNHDGMSQAETMTTGPQSTRPLVLLPIRGSCVEWGHDPTNPNTVDAAPATRNFE